MHRNALYDKLHYVSTRLLFGGTVAVTGFIAFYGYKYMTEGRYIIEENRRKKREDEMIKRQIEMENAELK
ncbi:hypothetical protein SNEBB_002145 [Seison nebaliae]|nr:hypothetical protein SNEBB_002145 [Seison nebaliae]